MNDTIAAIATAASDSGIGIIRVSGKESINKINDIFVTKSKNYILKNAKSHTIKYGFIIDKNGEVIDEVLVSVFHGPKSFTAEDTVEINCHGGLFVLKKILERVLDTGIRLAKPGEFTKRAFLNGRIDLSEAEAVMDLINSKNDYSLKASLKQLSGKLYDHVTSLREVVLHEVAFIESALDDPEHFDLSGYPEELKKKITGLRNDMEKLISSFDNGKIIREGISTVIVGKPNAGKSSLLNILVGSERAIVTDIAGTTRDIIEETVNLNGISLNIVDTAGIRDTEDIVEKIGVDKAYEYAENADLIIYIVDSSVPLDESDEKIIGLLKNKKNIVLLNKSDLDPQIDVEELREKIGSVNDSDTSSVIIKTSTLDNTGIEEFEKCINDMFFSGQISLNDEIVITRSRHKEALINAFNDLGLVLDSIEKDLPEDFYSIDLMNAYSNLGTIIGEEVEDDLVEKIFSEFCMGK